MKRFLIATALTATLSTAAFAASEAETAQIHGFLPTLNVEMLDDTQVAVAMNIISGSDSRSTKLGKLQSIVQGIDYAPTPAMITEAEMALIQRAAPDADLSMATQAQVDTALQLISSGKDASTAAKVQAVLSDNGTAMSDGNSATEAEMIILERYLPTIDVLTLSETELNSALAVVYSGDSPSDISGKLAAMVN